MLGLAQEACAAGHLSEDGTAFLEEHRIRAYEVGPDQQTTIVTMANLLQVCIPGCPAMPLLHQHADFKFPACAVLEILLCVTPLRWL